MRTLSKKCALLAALVAAWFLVPAGRVCLAQSNDDIKTLVKEIQEMKAAQDAMQKDITAIKERLIPQPPPPFQGADISIKGDPSMGNKDARVTLVEFTDYQCPFCGRAYRETYPPVVAEYVKTGKVRYIVHDYPLEQLHPNAFKAAEAAHCAGDQGKYWEMHDRLFGDQKALDEKGLVASAQALGLDAKQFQQCLDTGKFKAGVQSEVDAGRKLGVTGTPTFFLGPTGNDPDKFRATEKIGGAFPYTAFKKAIDDIISPPKVKSVAKPAEAPAQKTAEQAKPGS
ncbi:MAG: DsbA family protein [Acidobacteria bacterium]|nr:MAG: DsbA family protein [Acidobacteriota bacterium]